MDKLQELKKYYKNCSSLGQDVEKDIHWLIQEVEKQRVLNANIFSIIQDASLGDSKNYAGALRTIENTIIDFWQKEHK